jgi:uncharacterized protein YjbI with pentapeptide repeats
MSFTKSSYYQEKLKGITTLQETITEVEFEECQFTNCSLVDVKFEKCTFINCKFDNCMISAVVPTQCRFVDVRFTDSKVMGFDWTKAKQVQNVSFEKCQIDCSNFRLLKLHKINMIACIAKEADFTETDFTEGNFTNTDFERSIFSKTILTKANFAGAKNYAIDARHNSIKGAHFSLPEALILLDSLDVVIQ